jgi:hypothetical protein
MLRRRVSNGGFPPPRATLARRPLLIHPYAKRRTSRPSCDFPQILQEPRLCCIDLRETQAIIS